MGSIIAIERDDPARADVRDLLGEHLADMFATSPPESVHALDVAALSEAGITFWTAREGDRLLGCAALKELSPRSGEIKSMRTIQQARSRGVATALLTHVLDDARRRKYERLFLETGSKDFFEPARRLYRRNGFRECAPFADYRPDPNSVYMTLPLSGDAPTG